jgi:hypothetical protein
MLSPRISCSHFYFLVSRAAMEVIDFPSVAFCLYVVALYVYREQSVAAFCSVCRSISNGDEQFCIKLGYQC